MSDIITVRDGDIIAAEINVIKENAKKVVISSAIEIGRRLVEAKSVVEHGQWMKWLEEKVDYSQSTANNLMKLYQEYGTGEVNLFDNWINSEAFGKLTYTQHLALLALPFEERADFAEKNPVADMSTRELEQAVRKELEGERQLREQVEKDLEAEQAARRDAEQDLLNMQQKLAKAKSSEEAWEEEIKKLRGNKIQVEAREKAAKDKIAKLEGQLKDALEKVQDAEDALKKAKVSPDIPEAVMEQLRQEAQAEAAKKYTGDIQKQLKAANAALESEQQKTRAIEEKLVAAQRRLKAADPDVMEYHTLSQKLMADYKVLDDLRRKIKVSDKETGTKLEEFQQKMVQMWANALGI